MKTYLPLIAIAFLVTGCASMFNSEVVETFTNEAGEVTETVATATTLRDKQYLDRGNTRDKLTKDMFLLSGITRTYERYTYTSPDGSFTFTSNDIKTETVRAPHTWQQNIETKTPDHRFWKSFDTGMGYVFKGFLSYLTFGVLEDSVNKDTTTFQGDYVTGSYNPATTTTNPYVLQ